MNSKICNGARLGSVGTLAVISASAAIASGDVAWPQWNKPTYSVDRLISSYSAFMAEIVVIRSEVGTSNFARDISNFYKSLTDGQEPLGAEFEAVWDDNVEKLYES